MQSSCRSIIALLVFFVVLSAPSNAFAERRVLCVHGLEAGQLLSVRSGPGREHSVVGQFPAKACNVRLAGACAGAWCQMTLGASGGWVDTRYIAVYELPGSRAAELSPRVASFRSSGPAVATGACVSRVAPWDTLRIRTGPGMYNEEIGAIPASACGVGLIGGCSGLWCRVAWRGRAGWVNTYYLN